MLCKFSHAFLDIRRSDCILYYFRQLHESFLQAHAQLHVVVGIWLHTLVVCGWWFLRSALNLYARAVERLLLRRPSVCERFHLDFRPCQLPSHSRSRTIVQGIADCFWQIVCESWLCQARRDSPSCFRSCLLGEVHDLLCVFLCFLFGLFIEPFQLLIHFFEVFYMLCNRCVDGFNFLVDCCNRHSDLLFYRPDFLILLIQLAVSRCFRDVISILKIFVCLCSCSCFSDFFSNRAHNSLMFLFQVGPMGFLALESCFVRFFFFRHYRRLFFCSFFRNLQLLLLRFFLRLEHLFITGLFAHLCFVCIVSDFRLFFIRQRNLRSCLSGYVGLCLSGISKTWRFLVGTCRKAGNADPCHGGLCRAGIHEIEAALRTCL